MLVYYFTLSLIAVVKIVHIGIAIKFRTVLIFKLKFQKIIYIFGFSLYSSIQPNTVGRSSGAINRVSYNILWKSETYVINLALLIFTIN